MQLYLFLKYRTHSSSIPWNYSSVSELLRMWQKVSRNQDQLMNQLTQERESAVNKYLSGLLDFLERALEVPRLVHEKSYLSID
jgi:hypothetical protein